MTAGASSHELPAITQDAIRIWHAGVAAASGRRLVQSAVSCAQNVLHVDSLQVDLDAARRILVVGAGKACRSMLEGLRDVLGEDRFAGDRVSGWLNVPESSAGQIGNVRLFAARPDHHNLPTREAVSGTQQILQRVSSADPQDLCICLLSGGGSALLPAPRNPVTLADKIELTRWLSGTGTDIRQINMVRKQISRVKGGGLARACRAGRLIALIISDVMGNPLELIASGPTVLNRPQARRALAVLENLDPQRVHCPASVYQALESEYGSAMGQPPVSDVHNLVIGDNSTAVHQAALCAQRLGYETTVESLTDESTAEESGVRLAGITKAMRGDSRPRCHVSGGEPVVRLVNAAVRGRGGRNQQLALAVLQQIAGDYQACEPHGSFCLLSGGTDGEDGPTDAAGAWIDNTVVARCRNSALDPSAYLSTNDAYSMLRQLQCLFHTGPTGTNVCDLRVCLVRPAAD